MIAKCLALRLSSVIGEIISEDQVGYIKGRRVLALLRLIDDVTEQLNVQQKPDLLVTVDYSQAFDRISNDYMLRVFEEKKNAFGSDILQ